MTVTNINSKRKQRSKFKEVERIYFCKFANCSKGYGRLNHLNDHIKIQNHGELRKPSEFALVRKQLKKRKLQQEILEETGASKIKNESDENDEFDNDNNASNKNNDKPTETKPPKTKLPPISVTASTPMSPPVQQQYSPITYAPPPPPPPPPPHLIPLPHYQPMMNSLPHTPPSPFHNTAHFQLYQYNAYSNPSSKFIPSASSSPTVLPPITSIGAGYLSFPHHAGPNHHRQPPQQKSFFQ